MNDDNNNNRKTDKSGNLNKKRSFFNINLPFQRKASPPPRPIISRPIPISSSCIPVTTAPAAPPVPPMPNILPTQEVMARRGRQNPITDQENPSEARDAMLRQIEEGVRRRVASDTSPSPSPRRHRMRNEDTTSPTLIPRRLVSESAANTIPSGRHVPAIEAGTDPIMTRRRPRDLVLSRPPSNEAVHKWLAVRREVLSRPVAIPTLGTSKFPNERSADPTITHRQPPNQAGTIPVSATQRFPNEYAAINASPARRHQSSQAGSLPAPSPHQRQIPSEAARVPGSATGPGPAARRLASGNATTLTLPRRGTGVSAVPASGTGQLPSDPSVRAYPRRLAVGFAPMPQGEAPRRLPPSVATGPARATRQVSKGDTDSRTPVRGWLVTDNVPAAAPAATPPAPPPRNPLRLPPTRVPPPPPPTVPAPVRPELANEAVTSPAPARPQLKGYFPMPRGEELRWLAEDKVVEINRRNAAPAPPAGNPPRDYTVRPAPAYHRPLPSGYFTMPSGEQVRWLSGNIRVEDLGQDPRWQVWLKETGERLEDEPFLKEWGGRKKEEE